MPKCKNDPTRSYKGTEPSPKGLGYCAHGMKEGDKKKGKDGNMWIIKKIKNGSLRWIKDTSKSNNKLKGYKKFYPEQVYQNGPYMVKYNNKEAYIYKCDNNDKFNKLLKKYKIKKIFIGKDKYYKKSKGNTMLLQISNNKYVFIGGNIYEFKTNDIINKYYSNTIAGKYYPQPIAVGNKNVYFLEPGDELFYIPLEYFPNDIKKKNIGNSYDLFIYNPEDSNYELKENWTSYSLNSVKIIN